MKPGRMHSLWRVIAAFAATVVLGLVFATYLRPGFMLDVANRLWLCF